MFYCIKIIQGCTDESDYLINLSNPVYLYISVTLKLQVTNKVNLKYSAQLHFQANSNGIVDLSKQIPEDNIYENPDLMSIFWLLKPENDSVPRFWPSNVENGLECSYQIFDMKSYKLLAEEKIYRNFMSEGVQRIELKLKVSFTKTHYFVTLTETIFLN